MSKIIQDSNIVTLDPNTTHNEIIKSGINVVLTIFGTAAHEYAYKNIKVINGGDTNSHFHIILIGMFQIMMNMKNYSQI